MTNERDETLSAASMTHFEIFKFWAPLAAQWLMMAIEGPLLTSLIARMPEPKYNLAAYGVAFSFAIIVEAPVIMMMTASTALARDRVSFLKLRRFANTLNVSVTILMAALLIPPVFDFVSLDLLQLPARAAELLYPSVAAMLLWPGVIGMRRFYHGVMIRRGQTKRVMYATIVRVAGMAGCGFGLYYHGGVDGGVVGGAALTAGVVTEGIATRLMTRKAVRETMAIEPKRADAVPRYRQIISFYYPLVLTSFIALGVHPFVTFFMGRAPFPVESLAVLPAINSFIFIFRSTALAFAEAGLALMGDAFEGFKKVREFTWIAGGVVTAIAALIVFSPLRDLWFRYVYGLTPELTAFAALPTMLQSPLAPLTYVTVFQRTVLIYFGRTNPITWATALEAIGIIGGLFLMARGYHIVGAVAASGSYTFGRILANGYLQISMRRTIAARAPDVT